ncbi:hypothetical protein [Bradyrhizobium guangdongense]|uniref:Uncharacterized protein n=1 Tax=Bradyrhizobium guangdongense TaxID=1325090 RepID=A0A410VD28_9BRAD|nr:hypothetical protein [Bradyrhizobium guangdongense]QAU41612.1 hypothetical protein X265_30965 [Bradyrhizobium guangdongense]QOZ62675.1 hypothetical protein XH86_31005 [Bradyrhizobium guangdongense]GGI33035.1 hypothetical protein GCM10010987_72380 [Bradyrhizobium guangdongense]
MQERKFYEHLSAVHVSSSGADKDWLVGAERDGVRLLTEEEDESVILYAGFQSLLIISIFARAANLVSPDKDKLYDTSFYVDKTWCIQKAWGGGHGHRMYLEPPFDLPDGHPLHGAEPIVFRRSFEGMSNYDAPIELSQKLVHSLGLHFIAERSAYCRLNSEGDLEEVIKIFCDRGSSDFDRSRTLVLIKAKPLAEFMAVGEYALYRKFDLTRFLPGSFSHWDHAERHFDAPDLFYNSALSGGTGSYIHGGQILRPSVTVDELIEEWKRESDPNARQYETFIIQDWKNERLVEWSCAPSALSNYFTKSDKPFEISPAFFSPDVLTKYKADPDKYDLADRSITCRNSWHLKTFDINEAGQVHTYIGYLQHLPFKEQQHWKLHNERPKGPISKRAYQTDFKGEWTTEPDPLQSVRYAVSELDRNSPAWWRARGTQVRDRVHYPVTTSSKEWADELLALDQMLVEGFVATELRKLASVSGVKFENSWQSLKLIQEILRSEDSLTADQIAEPLKELHHLRSKVSGHHTGERAKLEASALKEHGSLAAHFRSLCARCEEAFERTIATLNDVQKRQAKP